MYKTDKIRPPFFFISYGFHCRKRGQCRFRDDKTHGRTGFPKPPQNRFVFDPSIPASQHHFFVCPRPPAPPHPSCLALDISTTGGSEHSTHPCRCPHRPFLPPHLSPLKNCESSRRQGGGVLGQRGM
ncbi:unnamed protein product [Ixodes persulcatus]